MSSVTSNTTQSGKKSGGAASIIILAVVLMILSYLSVCVFGKHCTIPFYTDTSAVNTFDYDESILEMTGQTVRGNTLYVDFRGVSSGKTYVMNNESGQILRVYVHKPGYITLNNYCGKCRGDIAFSASFILILTLILIRLCRKYRQSTSETLCRYTNAWLLGVIIFLSYLLLTLLLTLVNYNISDQNLSFLGLLDHIVGSAKSLTFFMLPLALVISLAISISNIILMKNEGICLTNMLGLFLGIVLCVGTFLPNAIYGILDRLGVDVHHYSSFTVVFEMCLETLISVIMSYLICVLIGTSVSAVRAAKHIPKFNKDYILILGCQIRKDGGLTKLLQSRTDRAIEFAKMQKEKTGKDIVFVPSGGKGDDEVIAEAEAIHNYLVSTGIPEEQIVVENRSVNTDQNIHFSYDLIRERTDNPEIAFSTTNYHVFRAGCIADDAGIPIEGIGAKTKRYFWINAFIREFIAALNCERKSHIISLSLILLFSLSVTVFVYLSDLW